MSKYLIAIIPPEPIAGDIYKLKEYFKDKYNSKASLNSPAHITMHMPFEFEKENDLIEKFSGFKVTPFEIVLEGFNTFPPKVIFIDVKENLSLQTCQSDLVAFAKTQLNLFNSNYQDQPFHPHITLAFRDLKKSVFATAWDEFKTKSYHAKFECNRLSLLKHDGKFWREFS